MRKVIAVFGTRPEAIKMASVVRAFRASDDFALTVCVTGQHREMLDQTLGFFGLAADRNLELMEPNQSLSGLTAAALQSLPPVLQELRPDWLLVQGDTSTAMAAALAGYHARLKIAHVEAGLRTGDKHAPFPEEVNRRIISLVADLHFAPTGAARDALLAEGTPDKTIVVTGNTGIDALMWTVGEVRTGRVRLPADLAAALAGKRLVLVTMHRRENIETGIAETCAAVKELAARFDDIAIVLPVHPNPNVKEPIEAALGKTHGIHLVPPLDYGPFVALIERAHLILTDSGGIQEEATALGKPTLVMRDVTERPEALAAGSVFLAGANKGKIVEHASQLLTDDAAYRSAAKPSAVFGDGRAAERILATLRAQG